MMTSEWNESFLTHAVIDESGQYRYQFSCKWGDAERYVTFIMLNPSIGNQDRPDPTLRKCINYAKKWGYDGIKVANLFAYISTNPKRLREVDDPVGVDNNQHILEMIEDSEQVILAWGQSIRSPFVKRRIQEVMYLLRERDSYCLKRTVDGKYPKHPLFLKGDLVPEVFQEGIKYLK